MPVIEGLPSQNFRLALKGKTPGEVKKCVMVVDSRKDFLQSCSVYTSGDEEGCPDFPEKGCSIKEIDVTLDANN